MIPDNSGSRLQIYIFSATNETAYTHIGRPAKAGVWDQDSPHASIVLRMRLWP